MRKPNIAWIFFLLSPFCPLCFQRAHGTDHRAQHPVAACCQSVKVPLSFCRTGLKMLISCLLAGLLEEPGRKCRAGVWSSAGPNWPVPLIECVQVKVLMEGGGVCEGTASNHPFVIEVRNGNGRKIVGIVAEITSTLRHKGGHPSGMCTATLDTDECSEGRFEKRVDVEVRSPR